MARYKFSNDDRYQMEFNSYELAPSEEDLNLNQRRIKTYLSMIKVKGSGVFGNESSYDVNVGGNQASSDFSVDFRSYSEKILVNKTYIIDLNTVTPDEEGNYKIECYGRIVGGTYDRNLGTATANFELVLTAPAGRASINVAGNIKKGNTFVQNNGQIKRCNAIWVMVNGQVVRGGK